MRLKELRKLSGISQKELAKRMGVTPQTILNWENEIYEPKIQQLIQLADIFDVTIDYLVERKANNNFDKMIAEKLAQIDGESLAKFVSEQLKDK